MATTRPAMAIAFAVRLTVALCVTGTTLSACSRPSDPASTSTSSPSSSPVGGPAGARPTGPGDTQADLPGPAPAPTDDGASRAAATTVAAAAMASFVRVDLTAADWLSQLSTHLTADAGSAYYGTDPLEVPARAVTGPPRWDGSISAYLANIVVPTDVGDYRLLLVRDGQDSPWLVQTIMPPDGVR